MEDKEEGNLEKAIDAGSDIAGSAIGGVLGFLFGGPIGAIAGGASTPIITRVLKKVGEEITERYLSQREEVRIGAVVTFAIDKIQLHLDEGMEPHNKGLFDTNINNRSGAEELYEAGILAAQKEYEEQKIKFIGNLIGNLSFSHALDKSQALHLIKLAETLSWRQLCILSLAGQKEKYNLRKSNYIENPTMDYEMTFLLNEIMDLYNQHLIVFGTQFLLGITGIYPSEIRLEGVGQHLFNMMELVAIPQDEIIKIAKLLS